MKIFLNWSDDSSRSLAAFLVDWLPKVLQRLDPWHSDRMKAGEQWFQEHMVQLRASECGLLCLNRASFSSKWLFFEAGAMAAAASRIVPLLFDFEPEELPQPLSGLQVQAVKLTEEGVSNLIESLNNMLGNEKLRDEHLKSAFNEQWPKLATKLQELRAENARLQNSEPLCTGSGNCMVVRAGQRKWSDELAREVSKFVQLSSGKKEVSSAKYANLAKVLRSTERESIHVLYASEDSIKNYYMNINERWVVSEPPARTPDARRRLLIIEAAAAGDRDFRDLVARIYERLSKTSTLQVLWDIDLEGEHSRLIRDIGIFRTTDEAWTGLVSFAQLGTQRVFCQSPGSYYKIENKEYLSDVRASFDALWADPQLDTDRSLRRAHLEDWCRQVPKAAYRWATSESALSADALEALYKNELPAIRVPDFATDHECDALVAVLREYKHEQYNVAPNIERVGEPLFEYRHVKDKTEYFKKAREAQARYQEICQKAGWDPIQRVKEHLHKRCGIVARNAVEGGNVYFAGLFRFMEAGALVHVDFAAADAVGYRIDQVSHQVAWNVVLAAPEVGGECTVYDSEWCEDYETCRRGSYEYDRSLVGAGARRFKIRSVKGDAVLFNCRNFHDVSETEGEEDRITLSTFLGKLGHMHVLWS